MTENSQSFATVQIADKGPYFREIKYTNVADSDIGKRWAERLKDI